MDAMTSCNAPRSCLAPRARTRAVWFLVLAALPGCVAGARVGQAPGPVLAEVHRAPPPLAPPAGPLRLAQCLHLALQHQPRVAAARASLAAAQDVEHALAVLQVPAFLAPELPIRRQQAALGVSAAAAAVDQAEREAAQAVTRTWFTVVYAREQLRVTTSVVERISDVRKTAQEMLSAGARDVSATDVKRSLLYLRLAQARQVEAEDGVERGLAALKEAIGLGGSCRLETPSDRLPRPQRRPVREEVVAAALARRGEQIRAGAFVQIARLEVAAQGTRCTPRMQTFATGADLHASQVPPGASNTEYRPGGVPPEMPPLLAGSRAGRVKQALSLQARAQTVAETTRNLIALEAEDAFLRWRQADRQARRADEAAGAGDELADQLSKDLTAGLRVKVEEVLNARVAASQARGQLNEYLFREVLALADLERITAGGFCAGLAEPAAPPPGNKEGSPSEKKGAPGANEKDNLPVARPRLPAAATPSR
jgi:outer membrane protein TolC